MDKWEIESKISSNFDGMLTQGQQEVLDYIEQLKQKVNQLETDNKRLTHNEKVYKDKVNQLETNRDEALNLMEKCKFDKTDKYIAISEYKEYQELKAILERGKK